MFCGGHVCQDVVHLLEDKATALSQNLDLVLDMAGDFLGRAVRQQPLGIAAAAPESDVLAEVALQALRLHALAADLHRIDGVEAGLDEVRQKEPYVATRVQHRLHAGILGALPQPSVARLEELAVHPGRDHGARLHAEVIAEVDDVDVFSDQSEELLETFHMELRQPLEYVVGTVRFPGEQRQEVVIPVQILAPLHQIAAVQAHYRPVGAFAKTSRTFDQQAITVRTFDEGPWRRGDVPHHVGHSCFERVVVRFVLGPREVGPLEIQSAIGHSANDPAGLRTYHPAPVGPLRQRPDRYLAG